MRNLVLCCVECNAPTRPHRTLLAAYPGTVGRGSAGRCANCTRRNPPPRTRVKPAALCVECSYPLRTGSQTLEDFPGTRVHTGHGLCTACKSRQQRGTSPAQMLSWIDREETSRPLVLRTADSDDDKTRAHRAALAAYFQDRRRRGIPQAGARTPQPEGAAM